MYVRPFWFLPHPLLRIRIFLSLLLSLHLMVLRTVVYVCTWMKCYVYLLFSQNTVKMRDINQHITCSLCAGYLIDATTITECLHTCEWGTPVLLSVALELVWLVSHWQDHFYLLTCMTWWAIYFCLMCSCSYLWLCKRVHRNLYYDCS